MGKKTHAWFCGFIVTDKPEIAITVFMENAGGGGAIAAPVARQIFDFYMGNIEDIKRPARLPAQFRTAEELQHEEEEPNQESADNEPQTIQEIDPDAEIELDQPEEI